MLQEKKLRGSKVTENKAETCECMEPPIGHFQLLCKKSEEVEAQWKKMLKSIFFICHVLSVHALVTVHPRIDAARQTHNKSRNDAPV